MNVSDMSDIIKFAAVMLIASIPILAFTVGRPLARAWASRLGAPNDSERADLVALEHRIEARFQRLESYVQTMAVEVERIGEANRYLLNAAADPGARSIAQPSNPNPTREPSASGQ